MNDRTLWLTLCTKIRDLAILSLQSIHFPGFKRILTSNLCEAGTVFQRTDICEVLFEHSKQRFDTFGTYVALSN